MILYDIIVLIRQSSLKTDLHRKNLDEAGLILE